MATEALSSRVEDRKGDESVVQIYIYTGRLNLADGDDEEGPPSAGLDDDGDEFGVDGAEAAVPRHAGHPDVVDAVLGFPRLREDVAELALADHTAPERHVCGSGGGNMKSHVAHSARRHEHNSFEFIPNNVG